MKTLLNAFNRRCIRPLSVSPDDQRREYIFNVLIAFVTFAALATTISSGLTHILHANAHKTNSVPVTIGFLAFSIFLWWLSRHGRYKIGSFVLTGLLLAASLQLATIWSIELPMSQLLSVLVIVVAGLVISSRAVIVVTVLVSAGTILLGYAEITRSMIVNTSWLTARLEFSDAIGLVVIYGIVGAVAWLANNEIDSLLRRAWRSERALAKERDQLEVTVVERTKELQDLQAKRLLELQHFAEFGKVSAGLIHDVSTPLTAASLNLELLGDETSTELLGDALASLRHIESYLTAARKQLQGKSKPTGFLVSRVVDEVVHLLQHQARIARVVIQTTIDDEKLVFGDPVALHRIVANLIINALEAYAQTRKVNRLIAITIGLQDNHLILEVRDFGTGIAADAMPHIFEEFYTTKQNTGRGLGLGLAGVKRAIEQEFSGTVAAQSTPKNGTIFTLGIPLYERRNTAKHSKRP